MAAANHKPSEDLRLALRENLSPETIVAMIAFLQPACTKSESVNREMTWLRDELNDMLDAGFINATMDELGL